MSRLVPQARTVIFNCLLLDNVIRIFFDIYNALAHACVCVCVLCVCVCESERGRDRERLLHFVSFFLCLYCTVHCNALCVSRLVSTLEIPLSFVPESRGSTVLFF